MSEQQEAFKGPGPRRKATWRLDPPDGEGCVWIHGKDEGGEWSHNLGPADPACNKMVDYLAALDFGERGSVA